MFGRWGATETREIPLQVFGVVCRHCRSTVRRVLEDHEGVGSAHVDPDTDRVRVEASSDVEPRVLVDALRAVGYESRLQPEAT